MLYVCTACGLVYFWAPVPEEWPACGGCRAVNKFKPVEISARAYSSEYSEFGGDITGIETHVYVSVGIISE